MSESPEKPDVWDELLVFCKQLSLTLLVAAYLIALIVMLGATLLILCQL